MDNRPVAGVDVSKYFSDMCILAPNNEIAGELHFEHDFNGMTKAKVLLESVEARYGVKPVIVMEATSHYHRLFFYFLKNNGFEAIVINPLQSHAIKNISIRKVKSDRADAYRIALLYRLKELRLTNAPIDTLFDIRNLTRQHSDLIKTRTMYTNRLIADLDQIFPSFHKTFFSLWSATSLAVLEQYPSPQAILSANPDELGALIVKVSRRGPAYARQKVCALCEYARNDAKLNIQCSSGLVLIKTNLQVIQVVNQNLKTLDDEINRMVNCDPVIAENVVLLDSIPGISLFSAAAILAEIGDFSAFNKPAQLTAYFGLDPSTRQSGQFKGVKNKISKRGCRYLRQILNMVAIASISRNTTGKTNNPVLEAYYRKKAANKPHKVALCAVMNKLVHIIFAVLRDRKPFELRQPEDHAAWLKEKNKPAA